MSSRSGDCGRPGWSRLAGLLLPLLFGQPVAALDLGTGTQVHGFLTQGFVKTSGNRFFGDSDDGSLDFTEIGINASHRALPSVLLSGQLLSRTAGDMHDGSPTVDFALVDWGFVNSDAHGFGLMAGRVKNPLGLYNDTRDVAFTRPSIFLPQQVYFDGVRNLLLSSDGVRLYGRLYDRGGDWGFDLGAGRAAVDRNVEVNFLGGDFGGSLEAEDLALIARAEYRSGDGAWHLALSGARARMEFDAEAGDPVGSGELDVAYWVGSVQYNADRWSLTAEYMEEPIDFDDFGPPLDGRDGTVQGYYLQGSYLVRNDLELVVRYAEGFADKDDRSGRSQSAQSGGLAPAHAFYRKDWMIGLRWDVSPRFMLRAEYQRNDGTWTLSRLENPDPAATRKDWELFSVLASYRF